MSVPVPVPDLGFDEEIRYALPVGDDPDHLEWLASEAGGERKLQVPEALLPRTNEFIASTSKEARDGDIIDQGSWRLAQFRRNPVILDNHDTRQVVGRGVKVGVIEDALRVAIEWDEADLNPRGQLVAHQHRQGFRKAVSVRWRTGKRTKRSELDPGHYAWTKPVTRNTPWGSYDATGSFLEDNTLLEVSSVSVPSDPRALQVRMLHPARALLEKVPDQIVAVALEDRVRAALEDPELYGSDPFVREMRALVLRFVRTDREMQTALRALGLTDPPEAPPAPHGLSHLFPGPARSEAHGLAHLFPSSPKEET